MQVEDDRPFRGWIDSAWSAFRGVNRVPSTKLPYRLSPGWSALDRPEQEVVIIGSNIERKMEVGYQSVRFVRIREVWRSDILKPGLDQPLREERVLLHGQVLGNLAEVLRILKWIAEFTSPLPRQLAPQGEYPCAGSRTQKRRTLPEGDGNSNQERLPESTVACQDTGNKQLP